MTEAQEAGERWVCGWACPSDWGWDEDGNCDLCGGPRIRFDPINPRWRDG